MKAVEIINSFRKLSEDLMTDPKVQLDSVRIEKCIKVLALEQIIKDLKELDEKERKLIEQLKGGG